MSDDPSPSSATRNLRDESIADDEHDIGHDREETATEATARRDKRRVGLARKMKFMGHLMKSLDVVFMAEVCTLYYMECSLPRLLLRCLPHFLFLTPKADGFFIHVQAQRPHVLAILMPNMICILLHLACALPGASEATRGYLHGGVIIDFVGQKAPTSKLGLVAVDLVVLAIQCLMLAVHQEREMLRTLAKRRVSSGTGEAGEDNAADRGPDGSGSLLVPTQDLDSEERGVLRDAPYGADEAMETGDIELQPLFASSDENCDVLAPSSRRPPEAADMTDLLRSGNAVLADLHVVRAFRTAANSYHDAAAYSLQSIGYTATLAAMAAESRARAQAQRRQ